MVNCLFCNKEVPQHPHRRAKKYCNDQCKQNYFNLQRALLVKNKLKETFTDTGVVFGGVEIKLGGRHGYKPLTSEQQKEILQGLPAVPTKEMLKVVEEHTPVFEHVTVWPPWAERFELICKIKGVTIEQMLEHCENIYTEPKSDHIPLKHLAPNRQVKIFTPVNQPKLDKFGAPVVATEIKPKGGRPDDNQPS